MPEVRFELKSTKMKIQNAAALTLTPQFRKTGFVLNEKLQKNPFVGLHKNVCTGQCWLYQIDFGSNFTYGFLILSSIQQKNNQGLKIK